MAWSCKASAGSGVRQPRLECRRCRLVRTAIYRLLLPRVAISLTASARAFSGYGVCVWGIVGSCCDHHARDFRVHEIGSTPGIKETHPTGTDTPLMGPCSVPSFR